MPVKALTRNGSTTAPMMWLTPVDVMSRSRRLTTSSRVPATENFSPSSGVVELERLGDVAGAGASKIGFRSAPLMP